MSSVIKQVTANGDTVDFKLTVNGDQFDVCENAKVTFTIPNGVSLSGPSPAGSTEITVPKGYYNLSTNVWHIGDLAVMEQIEITFEFTVDNINLKDSNDDRFIVIMTLSSACTEQSASDNTTTLVIEVVDPCTQVSLSIGATTDATSASSSDLSIG